MASEPFTLRPATPRDIDRLEKLWVAFLDEIHTMEPAMVRAPDALERWRNDFPIWLRTASRLFLVAEVKQEIVAFLSAHRVFPAPVYLQEPETYVDELYVVPAHRTEGIGSSLFDRACDWGTRMSTRRIRLGVMAANEGGLAFWQKMGVRPFAIIMSGDLPQATGDATATTERKIGF